MRSWILLQLPTLIFSLTFTTIPVGVLAASINSVDLVYESKTYTPPFYKGRALPGSESQIKIVAIPNLILKNGNVGRVENLNFTWKKNSKVLGESSGLGKNTLLLKTGRLPGDSDIVEVIVSAEDGASAESTTAIQGFSPSPSLYLNDPVLGIKLEKSVGANLSLQESEVTIVAYPYFFEVADRNSPTISYDWFLGGIKANSRPNYPSEIILRRGSEGGSIGLSLSISNPSKILEVANISTGIYFVGNSQGGF
ncbi:MAG: hypothetical protein AAB597_01035 [Patescibacteria group bacterium]